MFKAADKWLPGYLASVLRRPRNVPRPVHVCFCICDHYEPLSPYGRQPHSVGRRRVARWLGEYPARFGNFRDAEGRPPQHTFFFPEEEYHDDFLRPLQELTAGGFGEVEIHLHHDRDNAENLRRKLAGFRDLLRQRYGLLGGAPGAPRYAFIHGNWALCNSAPGGQNCGVDDEIAVLEATGCYADLTFPSVPSPTQPRTVNRLYRIPGTARGPRCHDRGRPAMVGGAQDGLLLIQGPLALNWRWRKWGILPRIEHADLCSSNPPTPGRAELWIKQHIHVSGRPEWLFVKLHTHGCREENADVLLGDAGVRLHEFLGERYNDGKDYVLHYLTARELYNLVCAAEAGARVSADSARDFSIPPPPVRVARDAAPAGGPQAGQPADRSGDPPEKGNF